MTAPVGIPSVADATATDEVLAIAEQVRLRLVEHVDRAAEAASVHLNYLAKIFAEAEEWSQDAAGLRARLQAGLEREGASPTAARANAQSVVGDPLGGLFQSMHEARLLATRADEQLQQARIRSRTGARSLGVFAVRLQRNYAEQIQDLRAGHHRGDDADGLKVN